MSIEWKTTKQKLSIKLDISRRVEANWQIGMRAVADENIQYCLT